METRRYPAVFAQWNDEAAHEGRARLEYRLFEYTHSRGIPIAVWIRHRIGRWF